MDTLFWFLLFVSLVGVVAVAFYAGAIDRVKLEIALRERFARIAATVRGWFNKGG